MTQKPTATALPPRLQDFEKRVHTAMRDGKVPGAAVLLLQDGKVLFSQGFGKRNVAENLHVTPHTLFAIGSSSKAFTAAAMAMLVDEGKLEWDRPLRSYLPGFTLCDPFASECITPRDLLCHRSGLPRHDAFWYGSSLTRKEAIERLAHLEPSADFRACFQYTNLMYVVAGYVIEQITGQSWETFVSERIFKPLGMNASTLSTRDSQKTDDYALPYADEQGKVKAIPFYNQWQIAGPAGSINSNLEDMQHWLLFQLNQGKHGETQLLDAAQLAQNHAPQMVIPASDPSVAVAMGMYPEFAHWCYGQGWFVGSFRGHRMLQHGGTIDGFQVAMMLLPDDNAAVAVFANKDRSWVPNSIALSACDLLLGTEMTDWNGRIAAQMAQLKARQEKLLAQMSAAEMVPHTRPSHTPDAYCGRYDHPGYGTITITCQDEQLQFAYHGLVASLTHIHYDFFAWVLQRLQFRAKVSFATGENGDIESLTVKLETAVKAQVFIRVPTTRIPAEI